MLFLLILFGLLVLGMCVMFSFLRTLVGIIILVFLAWIVIKFFWKLFRKHEFGTAVYTVLLIAVICLGGIVVIRTFYFVIAWFGGV